MAKKITDENQHTNGTHAPVESTGNKENTDVQAKPEPVTDIPSYADEVLKSFTSYETLYVNAQGGFYTCDTPERIRGNSILYKNPHYKS